MRNKEKYSIDFRLQVVRRYQKGRCGYKKLARMFNLSRDTVRDWCLNPRLYNAVQMVKKKKKAVIEKDLEYYRTAALYWETYAEELQKEIESDKNKKKFN